MDKIRLFIDMDGTIYPFDKDASLEQITSKGYFSELTPYDNLVELIRMLNKDERFEVYLLSSVFQDDHSAADKLTSVNRWMPWMKERAVFAQYGKPKKDFIIEPKPTDVLLDDFTDNLMEWHGIGIKIYNGINGTKGRWHGYSVSNAMRPEILYNQLTGIVQAETLPYKIA